MFGKDEPFYVLVLSLRKTILSLGIVDISSENKKFLYTTKELIIDSYSKSLDAALKRVISDGLVKISKNNKVVKIKNVKIVLNASFYDVYTKELTIEKDAPFVLTEDQFKKAIEKHAEIISAEKEGKLILERNVTNVMINGYNMENPFGKLTKKISVSFYASFVDKKIIEDIKTVIKNNIQISKIDFSTFALNKFNSIRNNFLNNNNYLSIDIGEKYTDIFIVENNSLKIRECFSMGHQDVVDDVSAKCYLSYQSASSNVCMLMNNEINQNSSEKIIEVIKSNQKKWLSEISRELKDNQGLNIPNKVFVTSEDKISLVFQKALQDPVLRENLFLTEKEPVILNMNNQYFKKQISYDDSVETDIFLSLIALNLDL